MTTLEDRIRPWAKCGSLCLGLLWAAQSQCAIDGRHYYTLSNEAFGSELFLAAGHEEDGVAVRAVRPDAADAQQVKWQLVELPDGTIKFSPAQFGNQLSLDVRNDGGRNDATVLNPTARLFGQKWTLDCDAEQRCRVSNGWTHARLALEQSQGADSAPIVLRPPQDSPSQMWRLKELDETFDPPEAIDDPPVADQYATMILEGFTVRVSPALDAPAQRLRTLAEMRSSLRTIRAEVPARALKVLQRTTIWVENNIFSLGRVSVFNTDVGWLRRSGQPLEKVGGIQIANARQFSLSKEKGFHVLIHELAHAYQWRQFPEEDDRINEAYQSARSSGDYDKVAFCCGGEPRRAAAMDSPTEYFAELSSAYFERCEFFPFERKELQSFDRHGFEAIEAVWRVPPSKKP